MIKNQLPQIYHDLLAPSFLNLKVNETRATCDNCLRARDHRFSYSYKPHLKCCTFFPFFPNFAVGGILKKYPRAAQVVRGFIQKRQFALPLGLMPSPAYQYEFKNKKTNDFGRREDLLCPMYDPKEDRCSAWEYRGVVCTTYFCSSSYGSDGKKFWHSVSNYLSLVEMGLAEEALVHLDFSPRDISDQLEYLNMQSWSDAQKTQRQLSTATFRRLWNGYADLEEFYLKCFDFVENRTRSNLLELIGELGDKLEREAIQAGRNL